jgi:hypothetical protein
VYVGLSGGEGGRGREERGEEEEERKKRESIKECVRERRLKFNPKPSLTLTFLLTFALFFFLSLLTTYISHISHKRKKHTRKLQEIYSSEPKTQLYWEYGLFFLPRVILEP